jgi:hypothetical protein
MNKEDFRNFDFFSHTSKCSSRIFNCSDTDLQGTENAVYHHIKRALSTLFCSTTWIWYLLNVYKEWSISVFHKDLVLLEKLWEKRII